MINPQPIPLSKYCQNPKAPYVKPSGLLDIKGVLYLSIEAQNYGNNPLFCRQQNLNGWIVKSMDGGRTWDYMLRGWRRSFYNKKIQERPFHRHGSRQDGRNPRRNRIPRLRDGSACRRNDNWGTYGDYQPNFPTKWMTADGCIVYMVSSGSWDDYNFVVQKLALKTKGKP